MNARRISLTIRRLCLHGLALAILNLLWHVPAETNAFSLSLEQKPLQAHHPSTALKIYECNG